MGFPNGGTPGRSIATAGPKARTKDGGEAVVFVYLNLEAVAVGTELGFAGPRLLLASSRSAEADAARIREAACL
jgi:hypothetical protein